MQEFRENLVHNTPPESPDTSIVQEVQIELPTRSKRIEGRKTVRKDRASAYRKLKQTEEDCSKLRKIAAKYKKRFERLRNSCNKIGSPSPKTKVRHLIGKQKVGKHIRKRLEFGETLLAQLKMKYKSSESQKEKRKLLSVVCGKLMVKYRHLSRCAEILPSKRHFRSITASGSTMERNVRHECKSNFIRGQVISFLEEDSNSRVCPGKRDCITRNKVRKQKRVLCDTLANLHDRFLKEQKIRLTYATFCKIRPFWIVPRKVEDRETCVCKKHANMQFLVDRLFQLNIIAVKDCDKLCSSVCCLTEDKACMYGECEQCKDKKITILEEKRMNEETVYNEWQSKLEKRVTAKGKEITIRITVKEKVTSIIHDVVDLLNNSLPSFLQHVFNIRHQHRANKRLKDDLCDNQCVMQIDFSENYACKFAEETQGVHFGASRQQVSLHTGVIYCNHDQPDKKCTSFGTVSASLRHDAGAIWAHLKPILCYLHNEFQNIDKVHFLSDGPATQYKNKLNFFLFANIHVVFPWIKQASWNYSESGHGKGSADAIGGTLKRTADRLVAQGIDIPDASCFYEQLEKSTKSVKVFFITESDIDEVDSMFQTDKERIKPVPGSTRLHQLTWQHLKPGKLNIRLLSCFVCGMDESCCHFDGKWLQFEGITPSRVQSSSSLRGVEEEYTDRQDCIPIAGKWIAAIYDDQWYPGLVESIDGDMLTVSFMMKSSQTGSKFKWPPKEDKQQLPRGEILCLLESPPVPSNSRDFVVENSNKIHDLMAAIIN